MILDYIYHGEVQIYQEELDVFLSIAKKLKIEGLISNDDSHDDKIKDEVVSDSFANVEVEEETVDAIQANSLRRRDVSMSTHKKEVARIDFAGTANLEEVDQKIEELTDRVNGVWTCKACGKTSQRKRDLGWHIETHLDGLSFPCNECDKTFRSRSSLHSQKFRYCKKSCF